MQEQLHGRCRGGGVARSDHTAPPVLPGLASRLTTLCKQHRHPSPHRVQRASPKRERGLFAGTVEHHHEARSVQHEVYWKLVSLLSNPQIEADPTTLSPEAAQAARDLIDQFEMTMPGNATSAYWLARWYFLRGEFVDAAELLQELLDAPYTYPEALYR